MPDKTNIATPPPITIFGWLDQSSLKNICKDSIKNHLYIY